MGQRKLSLFTSVSLEYGGTIEDDACWLQLENNFQHINLAEVASIIKGMNFAILWKAITLHVFCLGA